jgi:hypothetical protein
LSVFERTLRATLGTTRFLALIYLTYACMYLAPTGRIRRWGTSTWLILFRFGPEWSPEVFGKGSLAPLDGRVARRRAPWRVAGSPILPAIPELQTQEA